MQYTYNSLNFPFQSHTWAPASTLAFSCYSVVKYFNLPGLAPGPPGALYIGGTRMKRQQLLLWYPGSFPCAPKFILHKISIKNWHWTYRDWSTKVKK